MTTKPTYNIQNVVASASLFVKVPLEKVAKKLTNTEYNPEQFPGLVIRIKEPKTSALIFSSGKVVCTGARTLDEVDKAIQKIIESLKNFFSDKEVLDVLKDDFDYEKELKSFIKRSSELLGKLDKLNSFLKEENIKD